MVRETELTDDSIVLRPYRIGDAENLYQAVRESINELSVWMPWSHADYSIEESRTWIESGAEAWEQGSDYDFRISDARDDFFLGGCGLNRFDYPNKTANIGYWVRTDRTQAGVATAAVRLLLKFGFGILKLNRLEIMVAVDNMASRRVAEKSGATREGTMRNRWVVGDKTYDMVMFSLIPADLT